MTDHLDPQVEAVARAIFEVGGERTGKWDPTPGATLGPEWTDTAAAALEAAHAADPSSLEESADFRQAVDWHAGYAAGRRVAAEMIRDLHRPLPGSDPLTAIYEEVLVSSGLARTTCTACGHLYPCPTVQAVRALEPLA